MTQNASGRCEFSHVALRPLVVSKDGLILEVGLQMLGVVLWSDENDRKAVFWCEDHGDLAYYEGKDANFDHSVFFDAGDMVQFDVAVDRRLRKAFNPRVVQERVCAGLPATLKRTTAAPAPAQQLKSAKVIAFSAKDTDAKAPLSAMKA
tara:strand:+ start:2247 stop:2693 length:447 start_codon:yes stop_codon:yes gene_type:complete